MYAACGGAANEEKGTTNLHQDVADAVNLIPWTYNPSLTSAIWHIFPRHTLPQLRQFLRDAHPELQDRDPIQAQAAFLTDRDLDQLAQIYKVVPWIIKQRAGDMLFIPAGCPHQVRPGLPVPSSRTRGLMTNEQVRNVQNTLKVACDFVSVHNLKHMAALRPAQRKHRLHAGGAEDVLQLHTLLWYAWLSASTFKVPTTSSRGQDGKH